MKKELILKFKKDNYGLVYSTELLLSIIILFVIIAMVINLSGVLNEKTLSVEELSNLEKISVESSELLLNNPGVPEDWENIIEDDASKNIIPGLALKTKNVRNGEFRDESAESEELVPNIISYSKLLKLSSCYDDLINKNLFNNSYKSSIAVYPLNPKLDFELEGENYVKTESCNHDNVWNLTSHECDNDDFWLCRSFRIYKKSLENYDFYLLSPDMIKTADVYYTIENLNKASDKVYRLDDEVLELDDFFLNDLENASSSIYTIHFKVPKRSADEFKSALVAVPTNMSEDLKNRNQLDYEYFTIQDVNFVMKTSYK